MTGRFQSLSRIGIGARITALYVLVFGLTLVVFTLFLFSAFIRNHQAEFDVALYNYAVDVARAVDVNLEGEVTLRPGLLLESEKVFPFALGETYLQLRTIRGRPVAKSSNLSPNSLPLPSVGRATLQTEKAVFETISGEAVGRRDGSYRLIHYFIDKPGDMDFILQVAVPRILLEHEKQGLLTFFLFSIPLVVAAAGVGGFFLSRRALNPVRDITSKLREVSARQLSERVPEPEAQDDIHELARTINEVLDRLEGAFRSQETFVADASHQLKTPLAILRGEMDVLRSRPRSAEETEEFLRSASEEVSYLSRMVEDLLTLARMDTGMQGVQLRPARLDETTIDAVARLDRLARQKSIRLQLNVPDSSPEVLADPDLLRCLVENLVENAIKYAPEKSSVRVEIGRLGREASLSVSDDGPGIAPGDRARIFERFFRAERTATQASGAGLGLALVRRIVDLHQGTIEVETPQTGGTRMVVRLPLIAGEQT